jgi:hypothetical protein
MKELTSGCPLHAGACWGKRVFAFLDFRSSSMRAKQKRGVLSKQKRFWGIVDDGHESAGRQGLASDLR